MKKALLLISLALLLQTAMSALAVDNELTASVGQTQEAKFDFQYRVLKEQNGSDKLVGDAFDLADRDRKRYVSLLEPYTQNLLEHLPDYAYRTATAVEKAKTADWQAVSNELQIVFREFPDRPDIILLKALAEKSLGKYSQTLNDLEYLYQLRQERSHGISRAKADANVSRTDNMSGFLRSSGQLEKLPELRIQEYERAYETSTKRLDSFVADASAEKRP